jgi:glycosyltransferase involved in cell wall biosynthesis
LVTREGYRERLRRKFISSVFARFARFLYVGKANHDYFRYHRVSPDKLFFSPHAVNNERFFDESDGAAVDAREWRKELGIPPEHQVVLFAGKLEAKKRPLDLLDALTDARPVSASLLFVGDGHLESELRRRACGSPNIYFAPFQNQSLMPRTYAASDLFVLPSYGPGETWGLAVNEAMCLSRAVVVSTHVGCAQDLVRSWRNGLVFEAGSTPSLADTLKEALTDRARLGRWGEEGRRMVASYSYEEATRGLMCALRSLP